MDACKIFVCLVFGNLIIMCVGMDFFGLSIYGLCNILYMYIWDLNQIQKGFGHFLWSSCSSTPPLLVVLLQYDCWLFFSWDSIPFFFFNIFSLCCSDSVNSINLSSRSSNLYCHCALILRPSSKVSSWFYYASHYYKLLLHVFDKFSIFVEIFHLFP